MGSGDLKTNMILSICVLSIAALLLCEAKPNAVPFQWYEKSWQYPKIQLPGTNSVDPTACPAIVSRADWRARPPKARLDMATPVQFVVLHHTYTHECRNYDDCCAMMRSIQNYHMDDKGWDDIAYSFLVGDDGLVYEGRGWDTVGSHAPWYNHKSIGISIIGNFTVKLPNQIAVDAVNYNINCAITNKKLDPDYILYGHRQATPDRTCPGDALFKEIQSWPHWKTGDHFPPSSAKKKTTEKQSQLNKNRP